MKKKFFAMYALAGALVASPVFTSCIDGEESESVTAVRTERAAAIKAKIAMDQAEAERKAQLEELKLAVDMANYEQQKAQYEKKLLEYQLEIEEAKAALKAYQETTLSELTEAYTTALSNVATTEWDIVKYNQEIAQLKEGFVSKQAYVAKETARLEAEIASFEAKIAELKNLQENGVDEAVIEAKMTELEAAASKAKKDYYALQSQYGIAEPAEEYDITDALNLATIKAYNYLNPAETYSAETEGDDLSLIETNAEGFYYLNNSVVITEREELAEAIKEAEEALAAAVAALGTEADKIDATYEVENDDETSKVSTAYAQLAIAKEYLKTLEETLAENEKALAALTAEATEAQKSEKEGEVKTAKEAIENFKKSKKTENTSYTFTVGEGEDAKEYTAIGLAAAELAIVEAQDRMIPLEEAVAAAEKKSEDFEAAIAAFAGEDYEAYKAAVAALDAAEETYNLAEAEKDAYDYLYGEDGVIETTGSDYYVRHFNHWADGEQLVEELSLEEAIAAFEKEIEYKKEDIAELEAVVEYSGVKADSEEALAVLIDYIEKQIAIEEANLALYNKQAEEAKAALDAYLAE